MATRATFFHMLMFVIQCCFSSSIATKLSYSYPGCPQTCGHTEIGYPFGIGEGCFLPGFELICNESIPYLAGSSLQLLEILEGEVRVNTTPFIVTSCSPVPSAAINLPGGYTASIGSNKFIAIGCSTTGMIQTDLSSGSESCHSECPTKASIVNSSCTGHGCCQSSLPSATRFIQLFISEAPKSPCSHGFVVENGGYRFVESDLDEFSSSTDISMRLEWGIGEEGCRQAMQSLDYNCGGNSSCVESYRGFGYLCECLEGYQGNPYLNGSLGCQDINECYAPEHSLCVPEAHCMNKVPGFICICPSGSSGDGLKGESGCRKHFQVITAVLATTLSIVTIVLGVSLLLWARKKRNLVRLREEYFRKNGGLLLQQHFASRKGIVYTKIFSAQELKKATNNYDSSRILGSGGHGTVYKGFLEDGSAVAVKKSQVIAQCQVEQFINELLILTQINHRNIVKLLGCCLQTQVPLLVYEFISNGSLYQKLHGETGIPNTLAWKDRLQIAIEIADALSYLHSYASMPIFHRDVKSSNVLLDENYTTKLADFGISRLVSPHENQVSTTVKGTIGYMDPEYFYTGKLTDKSDVYSFGVILLELITGKKPVRNEVTRDYSSLVMLFQSHNENEYLFELLDEEILREGKKEELQAVVKIARNCLRVKGEERPTMKAVVIKLASIGATDNQTVYPQILDSLEINYIKNIPESNPKTF